MMAPRSLLYPLVSLVAIFALSGTLVQNSLSKKQDDMPLLPIDDQKQQLPQAPAEAYAISCDPDRALLRVFMYDLPKEFHFGMLEEDGSPSRKRRSKKKSTEEEDEGISWDDPAPWPPNPGEIPRYLGGLYQQHSPEYWLTVDLLTSMAPSSRNSSCTAVRVIDPEIADVFFVPFFSSLSYNRYCRIGQRSGSPASCVEENDRRERALVGFLMRQEAWKRNEGSDHVILMHHPNSLRVSRGLLKEAIFLVADFGRYSQAVANVLKDVVAPYKHVIPTFSGDSMRFSERKTLLYFQGAIVRKEGGAIRQKLYELLKRHPGVHFTEGNTQRDGIRSATTGMRGSKFCLHLAGDTPSSNRLFDAIASHCVPVIISDDIELPFEDELDYSQFSLFVEGSKATRRDYVLNLLQGISGEEWTRMWERLKEVDRHFEYQHPALPEDAVHMTWKAIARKLPGLKLGARKQRRYGASSSSSSSPS